MEAGIGERLKKLRENIGLKQGEFAQILGLKQGSYSDIERGRNSLTLNQLEILVNNYKVNPIWIMKGAGQMFYDYDRNWNKVEHNLPSTHIGLRQEPSRLVERVAMIRKLRQYNKTFNEIYPVLFDLYGAMEFAFSNVKDWPLDALIFEIEENLSRSKNKDAALKQIAISLGSGEQTDPSEGEYNAFRVMVDIYKLYGRFVQPLKEANEKWYETYKEWYSLNELKGYEEDFT